MGHQLNEHNSNDMSTILELNNAINMKRSNVNLDQLTKLYRANGWSPSAPKRNGTRVTVEFHRAGSRTYVITCDWVARTLPTEARVVDVCPV